MLSLGATKDGALACEAVIVFDPAHAVELPFRRKRAGHTLSKGRFLGVQMSAWLDGDHWRELARHANSMAARLAMGLAESRRADALAPAGQRGLHRAARRHRPRTACGGRPLYDWGARGLTAMQAPGADEVFVRLVTSFATTQDDVGQFLKVARSAA